VKKERRNSLIELLRVNFKELEEENKEN